MRAPDAGYFLYMAYDFILRSVNVATRVLTEDDGVIVMHYFLDAGAKLAFGDLKPPAAERYPAIIHQYDRWTALSNSVLNACPKGRLRTSVYIRTLPNSVDDSETGGKALVGP
jgi:hypothetical protein